VLSKTWGQQQQRAATGEVPGRHTLLAAVLQWPGGAQLQSVWLVRLTYHPSNTAHVLRSFGGYLRADQLELNTVTAPTQLRLHAVINQRAVQAL
jgi:hypothetical protein